MAVPEFVRGRIVHEVVFVAAQFHTIQQAVDAVEGPTTIMVEPGYYDETVEVIDKEYLVIQSSRLSRRGVTITGRDGWGVLVVRRSTLHLSGVEVRSNGRLRGMWVEDSTLTLQDCIVAGNRTWAHSSPDAFGAGIECRHSSVRIQKSTIAGNTEDNLAQPSAAARGGGIFFEDCKIEIAGATIQANAAYSAEGAFGGGIWCAQSNLRMWRSRVTDNALRGYSCAGGGIYFKDPRLCELGGSVITGNGLLTGRGGGIFIEGDSSGVSIHRNTVVRQNHPDDVQRGDAGANASDQDNYDQDERRQDE
jgi:parallel beta helix pectate lyase-like protein